MRRALIVVVMLALVGGVAWGVRLLATESRTEEGSVVSPVLAPTRIEPQAADLPESQPAAAVPASADSAAPAPLIASVAEMPDWCPAGRIVGRVVDASGRPIAKATVDALGPSSDKINRPSASRSSVPLVATARSGGDGLFELSHVFAGCPLVLRIDSPDGRHQLRAGLAALPAESLDLGDIALPDWSRVMGLVSDGTGRAIAGAEVLLGNPYDVINDVLRRRGCDLLLPPQPAERLQEIDTGEDGTFKFTQVPPVEQEIAVFAPGYAPWKRSLSPKQGRAQTYDVTLALGLRITGTTVDEQGHPVPGATVRAQAESMELDCTTSDSAGRFELMELTAERHSLHASTDSAGSEVVTSDAGATGIELVLRPIAKPRGLDIQVVDATGSPAHDFDLWGGPDDVASTIGSYAGLADGRVTLPFSFTLRGQLWALARGQSSPSITLSPELLGQGPLCLRLQPSVPIEGRVIDAVTGTALAGAAVAVRILDGVVLQPSPTWCDRDGKFRIDYVPPGDVQLRAMAAGHCDKVLTFGADGPRTVELALVPGGTLVLDAPAAWRTQQATASHVRVISGSQRTLVDQDFSQVPCVLTALEPGRYVIELESVGKSSLRRSSSKGVEVEAAGVTRIDLSDF